MFKTGVRKNQALPEPGAATPETIEPRFIALEANAHLQKRGGVMRLVGNLLIVIGVLMLVGIGGWLGYREWSNQQDRQRIQAEFGAGKFEPSIADLPTPVP